MSEKPKDRHSTAGLLISMAIMVVCGFVFGIAVANRVHENKEREILGIRGDRTRWCTENEREFIDAYQAHHRNPDKPEKAEQMEAWRTIMVAGWGSYPREPS